MGKPAWIQLRNFRNAKALFILPCNAAACTGNYFRAEVYSKRGWNTWREADANLGDLRIKGLVGFAAVDSSTLELDPADPLGAIVLETEMHRVKNPTGDDWGAPSWRWFRPTNAGNWVKLERMTDALARGVRRVADLGIRHVFALVNPRAYFLSFAAAVAETGLLDKWVLFRVPVHPRHLIPAVREVLPFIRSATLGTRFRGGIYPVPSPFPFLEQEEKNYRHILPERWRGYSEIPEFFEVRRKWKLLEIQS
ncbi:MAG: hypothetical protein A2W25_13915 [candidate division Zixibacteria bacterium RBG_16_53_22]|nr:MAG: hypothetical protein A2W25_13915 [candidate division Zixibacteria bacterium RBG_16_53_22]